jgi:ATPase subunit of ABC transporter with duplicated ATPase domains
MLQIQHLTLTHTRDLRTIVSDFNFVLNTGDKAVLIGEEGNGKSTLLKWIFDPKLIADYAQAEGICNARGAVMGYLPQELPHEDRERTVYEYFSAQDCFWRATPKALHALAADFSLSDDIFFSAQKMGTLSGGERVKLQMAALLLCEPDIFLLDEPSNDIDIDTLEWLEAWIRDCPKSVLFISHDETLLSGTANRVILLEQLRRKTESRYTVANMPFAQFMAERAAAFDKQAQLAAGERREEEKAMERFRRMQQKVAFAQNAISRSDPSGGRLLKKKMASVKAMERRYERQHSEITEYPTYELPIVAKWSQALPIPTGKTVLRCDIPALRQGERLLAQDIHLQMRGPEKICIIGKNGAGKTTLLHRIWEMLRQREDIRACYMPQNYEELLDREETPLHYLVPGGKKEDVTLARTCLGSLRFTAEEMYHSVRALSGGQKAKLLLLKISMSEANVLVLDEPTRNFSPLSGPEIRAMLRSFPGAIISVSHDRKYMAEVCDKVYQLDEAGLHHIPL